MNNTGEANAHLRASVIIATHNRRDDLAECLESVNAETAGRDDIEVLVADDASDDGTDKLLAVDFPKVRTLRLESRRYPSAARNAAAKIAHGKLLLFLDSDGVVSPGWLNAMLNADDDNTVLLGCPVDYAGGRVQGTPRRATFLGKSLHCKPEKANTGPSCNFAFPKKCFDALGGFDEELPYYFEDSDLCIRARKAGYTFKYLPDALFRHKGNERKKGDAIRMQERNSVYAMLKAYRDSPAQRAAFTFFNGLWLVLRLTLWALQGRGADAALLLQGWREGYARYSTFTR